MERLRALKAEGRSADVRHRRDPRPPRGGAAHPRGAEAAGVPRLRQRRHRHAAGRPARPAPRGGQAHRALRPPGAGPDPRPRRHRPHPLGHPRRALGAQRPSAPGRPGGGGAQRHHRELPRACAPSSRPRARVFETETDTETVAQLCDRELAAGRTPVEAARATLAGSHGAFALCFLFEGEDDLLVAARRGSPLAIGYRRRRGLRRLRRAGAGAADPAASPISRRATTRC